MISSLNEFNWQPIDTLPWVPKRDAALPFGVILKFENDGYDLIGTTLESRTGGCGCCSDHYGDYNNDFNFIPKFPGNPIAWAWVHPFFQAEHEKEKV